MEANAAHIEQAIREAWAQVDVRLPAWSRQEVAEGEHDSCRKHFADKPWNELEITDVIQSFDCISFFDETETHGLLPAWLIASLRYPEENVYHWTLCTLGPEGFEDRARKLRSVATPEQKEAIVAFLRHFIQIYQDPDLESQALKVWI